MNLLNIISIPHFAGAPCSGSGFLNFPTWYQYLPGTRTSSSCTPQLSSLSGIWLIVAAVIEILLRLAAILAVGVIIYAGIEYMTSQGNPERTNRAQGTIIGAAVGLAIAILSAVIVTFIAGSIK
jgi:hypothetical protein